MDFACDSVFVVRLNERGGSAAFEKASEVLHSTNGCLCLCGGLDQTSLGQDAVGCGKGVCLY